MLKRSDSMIDLELTTAQHGLPLSGVTPSSGGVSLIPPEMRAFRSDSRLASACSVSMAVNNLAFMSYLSFLSVPL